MQGKENAPALVIPWLLGFWKRMEGSKAQVTVFCRKRQCNGHFPPPKTEQTLPPTSRILKLFVSSCFYKLFILESWISIKATVSYEKVYFF